MIKIYCINAPKSNDMKYFLSEKSGYVYQLEMNDTTDEFIK